MPEIKPTMSMAIPKSPQGAMSRPSRVITVPGFPRANIYQPTKKAFTLKVKPGSTINLAVCTGLGDIIWVYQKFAPYFDTINLTILSTRGSDIGMRSMEWMKLLPQVGKVKFNVVPTKDYNDLASKPCTLQDAVLQWMHNPNGLVWYSCNKWLEEGIRLDEIDPGSVIDSEVNLKSKPISISRRNYAVLYVSGDTRHQWLHDNGTESIWNVSKWIEYVKLLWAKYDLKFPLVCLGAKFDEPITMALYEGLRNAGIDTGLMLGSSAGEVAHLIKECELFIGYQSGLSVVADLYDKKQVMLWFNRLDRMLNTFCKRGHEGTLFFSSLFTESPSHVVNAHNLFGNNGRCGAGNPETQEQMRPDGSGAT